MSRNALAKGRVDAGFKDRRRRKDVGVSRCIRSGYAKRIGHLRSCAESAAGVVSGGAILLWRRWHSKALGALSVRDRGVRASGKAAPENLQGPQLTRR